METNQLSEEGNPRTDEANTKSDEPNSISEEALLLENQLCFSLYAASRRVISLYAPLLKRLDLTYTQYLTLLVLWEHQVLPVKDLGNYLLLDSGTLTPLLKKMEEKGMLTRTRSKEDERVVHIKITENGQKLKAEALTFLPQMICSMKMKTADLMDLRERVKGLLTTISHSLDD